MLKKMIADLRNEDKIKKGYRMFWFNGNNEIDINICINGKEFICNYRFYDDATPLLFEQIDNDIKNTVRKELNA